MRSAACSAALQTRDRSKLRALDGPGSALQRYTLQRVRDARCGAQKPLSVRCGEIIDDLADVALVDGGAVGLDHLRHFRLPEVLLEARSARLRPYIVHRVAGGAIALSQLDTGSRRKRRGFLRQVVGDRVGGDREETGGARGQRDDG